MATNHWAKRQKTFYQFFPCPRAEGRLSADPRSTLRRISRQGQGIVGPEPGRCIYHDWLLWAGGELLLGKAFFSTTAWISITGACGPTSGPRLTCPACLWAAQLLITQQLFSCAKDWNLGSGRACLHGVTKDRDFWASIPCSPTGSRLHVCGLLLCNILILHLLQTDSVYVLPICAIKPIRCWGWSNSHHQSGCTFWGHRLLSSTLDWHL